MNAADARKRWEAARDKERALRRALQEAETEETNARYAYVVAVMDLPLTQTTQATEAI